MNDWKKLAIFAGGTLFGSAGLQLLASRDAKKVYTHATAAALRAKESVLTTVTQVQEVAGDILAEAKEINEERAQAGETVEDEIAEEAGTAEAKGVVKEDGEAAEE